MDPLTSWGPSKVRIGAEDFELMRRDVAGRAPEEACGLLVGRVEDGIGYILEVIPTTNALHSPVRYRIEPAEQLAAFNHMDETGMELVGIYHSHPNGPAGPSATDLAEAFYPEAAYLIWNGAGGAWRCAAFYLQSGAFHPIEIEVRQS
jgi:proteasome lid subunit RPN8/RPN11